MRRILALLFVLFMISCAISLLTTRANSADLLPKKPPIYCAVLKKFERNCAGVKAATRLFGRARAEMLAIRCGATPEEIQEALTCLRI
jgi:hypothetical protein